MTLETFNRLPSEQAAEALARCCGARAWVESMLGERPFRDEPALFAAADSAAVALRPEDWREAFAHHPKIGDLESLRRRFATTAAWASGEQAGASGASPRTLARLAEDNRAYEEKFGYIFIVCATGKSADEMLAALEGRLENSPETEIVIAAAEQRKITRLRLEKLLRGSEATAGR